MGTSECILVQETFMIQMHDPFGTEVKTCNVKDCGSSGMPGAQREKLTSMGHDTIEYMPVITHEWHTQAVHQHAIIVLTYTAIHDFVLPAC